MLEFELIKKDTSGLSHARRGRVKLNHGVVETPIFMPVGTYGSVKAMSPVELKEIGSQIILGNTFHLWLRPGTQVLDKFGGLHGFMGWDKPILTDSGGFQVFSLGAMRKITEEGVKFSSPIDGSKLFLSPEISMQIQRSLNSDIVMQFDECTPYEIDGRPATTEEAAKSMRMSLRWAQRSMDEFKRGENPNALFGIVQGGMFERLRDESLAGLEEIDFPGVAIGGLSVGEPKEDMMRMLAHVGPRLPENKPHYLMGVGTPEDLVAGVANGIDMFDCVMPTRNARNGWLFTRFGDRQDQERALQGRRRAAGRELRLLLLQELLARLPAPSAPLAGNPGRAPEHHPQPAFLPEDHERDARGDRTGRLPCMAAGLPGRPRARDLSRRAACARVACMVYLQKHEQAPLTVNWLGRCGRC